MRALIFDFDGVIADTEQAHAESWARLAAEAGVPFGEAERAAVRGRTRRDALAMLMHGRVNDAMLARKQQLFESAIETLGPRDALPGVRALLEEARERGVPLGLASSSRNAVAILERLELITFFQVIADGNFSGLPKPDPAIYRWVADALYISPADCVVIEDSDAGVAAAGTAGCRVMAVAPARNAVRSTLAGLTIDALDQLTMDASAEQDWRARRESNPRPAE